MTFPGTIASYVLPLIIVAALASIHLPYPFAGDQTLFLLGAAALDRGEVLYVDFWDIKQPGIYLFFWLAGRLFGFSKIGVHLLELIWQLKFPAIAASIEEAGANLFTFLRYPSDLWESIRTTNVFDRLHEEFKRRIKTQ
jgi:hypothetical protein